VIKKVLRYSLDKQYITLSSTLYPEGISYVDNIVLVIVDKNYCNTNPWTDIMQYVNENSVAFMTASEKFIFEKYDGKIKIFLSAGIGESGEDAGCTINIGVFLDFSLNINGLVDLVRTVTEAKCGALRDLSLPYTGTASDAVAVGSLAGNEYFSGPSTELGKRIAKIVREKIKELLT